MLLCEGAKVQSGAVLSYGVVIGAKHTVPHYARVSLCKQLQSQVSSPSVRFHTLPLITPEAWSKQVLPAAYLGRLRWCFC